jgi:hypothetical protein
MLEVQSVIVYQVCRYFTSRFIKCLPILMSSIDWGSHGLQAHVYVVCIGAIGAEEEIIRYSCQRQTLVMCSILCMNFERSCDGELTGNWSIFRCVFTC